MLHTIPSDLMRGPNLQAGVDPGSAEELRALAVEQRARMETLRAKGMWAWYGDNPGDTRGYAAVCGLLGSVIAVTIGILLAPFHQGIGLVVLGLLAFAGALPHLLWYRPAIRRGMERFKRYELRPAAFIAVESHLEDPENDLLGGAQVVIGMPFEAPGDVLALMAVADELAEVPSGSVARAMEEAQDDGSREAFRRFEVGGLLINTFALPEERLQSRLLYVFYDPAQTGPHSVKQANHWIWGHDLSRILDAHPWRTR